MSTKQQRKGSYQALLHMQSVAAPRSKRLRTVTASSPPEKKSPKRTDTSAVRQLNSRNALRFRRILVPIDFSADSTRALKTALQLALRDEASLTLIHVAGPIYYLRDYGLGPVPQRRVDDELVRTCRQRLQALARRHIKHQAKWRVVISSGTAPRQILKAAKEANADLIVMPTRGLAHGPPEEIGSTAERVVRHADCPVLVLPAPHAAKTKL